VRKRTKKHSTSALDDISANSNNSRKHCLSRICGYDGNSATDDNPCTCTDSENTWCVYRKLPGHDTLKDDDVANADFHPTALAPKTYSVTYWATVKCGDQTIHIPVDSTNTTSPEKIILDDPAKIVWKWVQEKGLGDTVGVKDAFDLAKDMLGDDGENSHDVEDGCPLRTLCHSHMSTFGPSYEGAAWGSGRSIP
jgi:hypothetical protein